MKKRAFGILIVFALPVALFLLFSLIAPGFGMHSLRVVINQAMLPTAIGCGMAFIMQCGLSDFTAGCRVIGAAAVGALFAAKFGFIGFILGCIVGSLLMAVVAALLYRYLRIPSMVVGLGFVLIGEIFAFGIGALYGNYTNLFIEDPIADVFAYPFNILWSLGAAAFLYVIMYRTRIGFHISSVGSDEVLAQSQGVVPSRVKTIAYLLSAVPLTVAACLQISLSGILTVQTNMTTMNLVFEPIMGVVIGTQLVRLCNNLPLMIVIGEVCLTIIFNGLIACGLPDSAQNVALGLFMFAVLGVSGNVNRISEHFRRQRVRKTGSSFYDAAA